MNTAKTLRTQSCLRFRQTENDPFHTIPETGYVEVDQQAKFVVHQFQVCKHLREMNIMQSVDRLHLNNDLMINLDIQAKS